MEPFTFTEAAAATKLRPGAFFSSSLDVFPFSIFDVNETNSYFQKADDAIFTMPPISGGASVLK